jgi:hypothetical protein
MPTPTISPTISEPYSADIRRSPCRRRLAIDSTSSSQYFTNHGNSTHRKNAA